MGNQVPTQKTSVRLQISWHDLTWSKLVNKRSLAKGGHVIAETMKPPPHYLRNVLLLIKSIAHAHRNALNYSHVPKHPHTPFELLI